MTRLTLEREIRYALPDLGQAHAAVTITENGGAIDVEWGAADVAAFELGAAHAGPDPLDDQVAFQLGDGADDDDDGAAQRAAGVDVLAEADELDVEVVQFVEHFQEVTHGAGHAIAGPDQHDVELPRRASASIWSRPGRRALVPLIRSVYSCTISKPRCAAIRADRRAGSPDADRGSRPACRARRASSVLLQDSDFIVHLADGFIEEAEATETGLRLIHFEQGLHLEQLDGGADALESAG